jgi:hypothetical protein
MKDEYGHDVCHVCRYPTTDGSCLNPVCGGTPEAEARFETARIAREAEEAERRWRQEMHRRSFERR